MNTLGRHIVIELYGCDSELLTDVSFIEESMVKAAQDANATVINSTFHHFSPFGVSGAVVIQESHLAIHTWPEFEYAALDIFTCGEVVNPWTCYKALFAALKAKHGSALEMGRGQLDLLDRPTDPAYDDVQHQDASAVSPVYTRNIWYTERGDDIALSLRHTGQFFYRKHSDYQKVEVIDTFAYGKMLALDGRVMTTEKDEYVYHEMITHLAMLAHPDPKKVLVIGAGDGGVVRELVRHDGLEKITMVEIDDLVIEACRLHLPEIAKAFDHPKLELIVGDGIQYVDDAADGQFDIVIVDSTDPIGPASGLFSENFYRQVHRILNANGIMVVQSESPRFNVNVFQEIYQCFRRIFGGDNVHCCLIYVPTYPTGTWSLAFCSKSGLHPVKDTNIERRTRLVNEHQLRYFNAGVQEAAFQLPNYVIDLLSV
jgi:spermidine synthase